MATKLAVLVIHGMGSQDPDFAHQSQASFQTGTDFTDLQLTRTKAISTSDS